MPWNSIFPLIGAKGSNEDWAGHTIFFSLFPFYFCFFLGYGVAPRVARSVCVVSVHPENKKRFCVALFFSTVHPACNAQRSERVKSGHLPFFLGNNPNPAFQTGGNTEMKAADCKPNATNLFFNNEMIHQSPSLICWIEWLWHLINFSVFLLIYFCHLNWGDASVLHSSISVLKKAVSLLFLSSHLECQPVFYSEAALPI